MFLRGLLVLFFLSLSFQTQAQSRDYNHVQCLFEKLNGTWNFGYVTYFTSPISLKPGQGEALHWTIWFNGEASTSPYSGACSYVKTTYQNGDLEFVSTIHNSQWLEEMQSSTCQWTGEKVKQVLRKTKRMGYGESLIYEFRRKIASKNRIRIIDYIPTKAEMKKLEPSYAESLCNRFHP